MSAPPQRIGAGTVDDPFRYQFADGWVAPVNPVAPRRPRRPRRRQPDRPQPPPQPTQRRPTPTARLSPDEMMEQLQSGALRRQITDEWDDAGITFGRQKTIDGWDYVPTHGGQDVAHGTLQRAQGFTAQPQVVTRAEMDALIEQGHTPIYRGVKGATDEIGDSYVNQWTTADEQFHGLGIFGNGTYTTTERATAATYSGGDATGARLMEMALAPDARVVTQRELYDAGRDFRARYRRTEPPPTPDVNDPKYGFATDTPDRAAYARDLNAVDRVKAEDTFNIDLMADDGRVATMLGYDAIEVPMQSGEIYYVILNRGATAVVG